MRDHHLSVRIHAVPLEGGLYQTAPRGVPRIFSGQQSIAQQSPGTMERRWLAELATVEKKDVFNGSRMIEEKRALTRDGKSHDVAADRKLLQVGKRRAAEPPELPNRGVCGEAHRTLLRESPQRDQ
jgi:hypothetical protein